MAVYGDAETGGIGVVGYSYNNEGVDASSTLGIGLYAFSGTTNGILAQNPRTDESAAVISAVAGSTAGLAYWGDGGIIITGDAKKPGGGSWSVYSDARLKKDIHPFKSGLEELSEVRPVTFKYNGLGTTTDDGREYVGVIAQDSRRCSRAWSRRAR